MWSPGRQGSLPDLLEDVSMDRQTSRDIVARSRKNPLISLEDLPFRVGDIWNAAVVRFEDKYVMLFTVEELEGHFAIYRADSADGEEFTISPEPFMARQQSCPEAMYESVGIRDPRITPINGEYFITYVADGDHGLRSFWRRFDSARSASVRVSLNSLGIRPN